MDKFKPMVWDIFCRVIDNYGDIGVCWRLGADLASRGERVRLWVDDPSPLAWLAPQGCDGVDVIHWSPHAAVAEPGDRVVEAFGCELPLQFQTALARKAALHGAIPWVNLEYLTAEPFAERSHGLPSPVLSGPASGLTKHFFYPGFTSRTGGLLREPATMSHRAAFDRAQWLAQQGIAFAGEQLVSLFCYEPAALPALLDQLAAGAQPSRLLVTPGRATLAVKAVAGGRDAWGSLAITWLPPLPQPEFDRLLWACDLNFVRGEDSLVRALWAGNPLVWQAYPQEDGAHHQKIDAFLDAIGAPASLRQFHAAWNGAGTAALPQPDLPAWGQAMLKARTSLLRQDDLASQLLRFVQKKR